MTREAHPAPTPLTRDVVGLAALFITSGTTHLAQPQVFEPLMPKSLPNHRAWIYASGVAELVCAAGLLHPRTRRAAGYASAALLVSIFPGNIEMSARHARRAGRRQDAGSRAAFAATLARLPLQLPLIRTALKAAGRVS